MKQPDKEFFCKSHCRLIQCSLKEKKQEDYYQGSSSKGTVNPGCSTVYKTQPQHQYKGGLKW